MPQHIDLDERQSLDCLPPHSLEAECAVLGAMLMDPVALDAGLGGLDEEDFFKGSHRLVHRACRELVAKNLPVDLITIQDKLATQGQLEAVGGPVALAGLSEKVASATNVDSYIKIVADKSALRRLIHTAAAIAQDAFARQDEAASVLDRAASSVLELGEDRSAGETEQAGAVVLRTMNMITDFSKRTKLSHATGFPGLDDMMQGLDPGSMTIVAARPGMGKTALCLNIALELAGPQKLPGAIFSFEMDSEHLMLRMLATTALVDMHHIRSGKVSPPDQKRLGDAAQEIYSFPIHMMNPGGVDLDGLRAKIRRLVKQKGITWAVIDYLQKIPSGLKRSDNRNNEVGLIARGLKDSARTLGLRLIVAAQLNRDAAKGRAAGGPAPKPTMSDLRDSGEIEQEADNIILLWRDKRDDEDPREDQEAELILEKQRQGRTGKVPLIWQGRFTRYASHRNAPTSSEAP